MPGRALTITLHFLNRPFLEVLNVLLTIKSCGLPKLKLLNKIKLKAFLWFWLLSNAEVDFSIAR